MCLLPRRRTLDHRRVIGLQACHNIKTGPVVDILGNLLPDRLHGRPFRRRDEKHVDRVILRSYLLSKAQDS